MGIYVEPPGRNPFTWLENNGVALDEAPASTREMPGCLPVCLVVNPAFDAGAVAFDDRELAVFKRPDDGRRKFWYWVEIKDLKTVTRGL